MGDSTLPAKSDYQNGSGRHQGRPTHPHRRVLRLTVGLTCVAVVALGPLQAADAATAITAISDSPGPGSPVGSPIFDTATLGGGINPTGNITFRLYVPSDLLCLGTPAFTWTKAVSAGGYYASANYTPSSPGTYHWTAAYSGDANNAPAASACAAGPVNVTKQKPRLSGSAAAAGGGTTTIDTATLRGAVPTGTLVFKLYGPGDTTCTGTPVATSSLGVAGDGTYSSASATAKVGGTHRWVVRYSGDANNEAAATTCLDAANAVNLMAGVTLGAGPTPVLGAGTLTVTWNGIAAPSSTDWVALYAKGAPDSAVLAWRYTTGAASGIVTLKVPWLTLPGQYEVRLFAQNGYARLAAPAPVTVV
jgi:hypothetical protein